VPKEYLNPPSLFPSQAHGFSQVVAASGRRTLYLSGQTAWDAQRRLVGGDDLAAQARQAFGNVRTAVEAGGGRLEDVVSLRIYVVDYRPEKATAVAAALRESFPGPAMPATTWLGVTSLADPGFLIEVEATAVVEGDVVPAGYNAVTPRIVVGDPAGCVAFLKTVFHATGEVHPEAPAEVRIGDSVVLVSGAGAREAFPAFLYVYVADAEAVYRRALEAGAESLEAPRDTPYGDRRAMVRDRWGNVWQIATRLRSAASADTR
jgi:enamine deaminase RidA (YjgF/YER057c/UK114 family)/uncharacterized glyoxalase superfamily protein PhnB